MTSYKLVEVIECYRYNSNHNNNQDRISPGNPEPNQLIQGKKAKCHHSNGQSEGKDNPFYDTYLLEEDECPGKTRQKEHKYEPKEHPDDG